jgi:peptidoglycan hydrolase-like protein with peptidoglycan-binding domain
VNALPVASPRRGRRRVGIAVLVNVALIVGYLVWTSGGKEDTPAPLAVSTAQVATGSMVSETLVPGTVQYATKQAVASGLSGVVTEIPTVGSTIGAGGVAYRVDTRPVTVLSGSMPAWRDLASGMTEGEDIRQLEQNLKTFGFFAGEPDARFTWDTTVAVRDWQKSLGLERTGSVERSMILFTGQDLRVDAVESGMGTQVGPGTTMYQATSVHQVVELNVKSSDREIAVVGGAVTVTLPTGATTDGVIDSVGTPMSKPAADGTGSSSIVVPVRIAVADQAAIAGMALAGVSVSFASTVADDVLTVPVDALVPVSDTGFAVELPGAQPGAERTLLPVTVGAFASGIVEISGDEIVDGLAVVVPER